MASVNVEVTVLVSSDSRLTEDGDEDQQDR
jgi:hypothetical protein